MSTFTDKLIGKGLLLFSTIFTLAMAIAALVANIISNYNENFALVTLISICCFIAGICTIILQLIVFNYQIHGKVPVIDEIKDYIYKHKTIRSHTVFDDLKAQIDAKINENKVNSITIICYGTSGFGNLIQDLNTKKSSITVDILVCSPESKHILYKDEDRPRIENVISICKENDKITITKSLIPPTIRACILYDKNKKPIWASIQTYYFEDNKDYNSFNYRKFYAVVADEENHSLLNEMKTIISDEFERLVKFSLKEQKFNDNQIKAVLHCRKKKKITKDKYKEITNCQCQSTIDAELSELVDKKILNKTIQIGILTAESYVLAEG